MPLGHAVMRPILEQKDLFLLRGRAEHVAVGRERQPAGAGHFGEDIHAKAGRNLQHAVIRGPHNLRRLGDAWGLVRRRQVFEGYVDRHGLEMLDADLPGRGGRTREVPAAQPQ